MKKFASFFLAAALGMTLLTGCTSEKPAETAASPAASQASEASAEKASGSGTSEKGSEEAAGKEVSASSEDDAVIRVGGLKGPTTMGLVKLMDDAENGRAQNQYEFTMVTAADELTALVAGNKVDIALLPANVAGVLYNKTNEGISVIDINTLGVLYLVSSDTSITSVEQLKGKTVYLTGKGTTPEYSLRYLMSAAGLAEDDVTLEFKSEPAEVASVLAEDPSRIGLLPQPFVTSALAQNENLSVVLDLTKAWDEAQAQAETGSRMITGVTIVNNGFLASHSGLVDSFLAEHEASIRFTSEDPDTASQLIEAAGIVPKAAVAKKALPGCNIAFLSGEEMKTALSGYLKVLFDQNPASTGGALPDDAFYYTGAVSR
ncbi:MAG: ABC transporter substrate-binding protein [Sakamotonia sp.]|jgi:NitT/TauT family transport system substrate-binding protein